MAPPRGGDACPECTSGGYPGLHSRTCSRYSAHDAGEPWYSRGHLPTNQTYETCEKCWTVLAERKAAFEFDKATGHRLREMMPKQMLRPVGEPCPDCGNAEPMGTYPDPWSGRITLRVGEKAPYAYIRPGYSQGAPLKTPMAQYQSGEFVVDAIQWTGENMFALGLWRGQWPRLFRDFYITAQRAVEISVLTNNGTTPMVTGVAHLGDWILRGPDGTFAARTPTEFDQTYTIVQQVGP